jgi:DNA polymerase-3 subunit alpha
MLVNLNVHTEYDRIRGGASLDEIVARLNELNQSCVAITDPHCYSQYDAWQTLKVAGIKPILGLECQWCKDTSILQDRLGYAYYPLTLLAVNNTGLHNLMKISTAGWTHGFVEDDKAPLARVTNSVLKQYASGIVCLTGNQYGFPSQALTYGKAQELQAWLLELQDIFGSLLWAQIPVPRQDREGRLAAIILDTANRLGIQAVATATALYAKPQERTLHELKACTTLNKHMRDPAVDGLDIERKLGAQRLGFAYSQHILSEDEFDAALVMYDLPYELLENTSVIADYIDSDSYFSDRKNRYPKYQNLEYGFTPDEMLKYITQHALVKKFGGHMPPQEYIDRANYELRVIKKMGYSDYMLIVYEYLRGIREAGILCGPGRGSCAGSLVAYALEITQIDPIKYGLIFERFLNEGRGSIPKIFDEQLATRIDTLPCD